jgi:hypothetical protein
MEPLTIPRADRLIAENTLEDSHRNIPGWGVDADSENDPTYPMKHRTGADYEGLNYEKAPQQKHDMTVFKSVERPTMTRVFGTSTPPTGVSGSIRAHAYKYSESHPAHWMTLILADRVNVVEGIIDDLAHGHIPNIFAERGWRAEWKYNRGRMIRKVVTTVVVTTVIIGLLASKRKKTVPGLWMK